MNYSTKLNHRPFRKTRWQAGQRFRRRSTNRRCTAADRTVRPERMVASARQHRLSRHLRRQPLQRALSLGAGVGGDPLDADHRRDPAQGHARGFAPAQPRPRRKPSRNEEHRPKSHRAHLEWTPSRIVQWAATIGPHTARLFERIMADKPHPEMGYRALSGHHPAGQEILVTSAWKRRANGRCSRVPAATRASNRS